MRKLMTLALAFSAGVFSVQYLLPDQWILPGAALVLAVFFFGKLGTAYFDYRKHGQFEWAGPAILFACLVFTLTAPMYVWQILGM